MVSRQETVVGEDDGAEPSDDDLTACLEPFDSFWEAPEDVEAGYNRFARFYASNYLPRFPEDRGARILVVSCGAGYMVNLLNRRGYDNVIGIDSSEEKVKLGRRRGLDCRVGRVLAFLDANERPFDVIFAEQEINHLTKREILTFLTAAKRELRPGGRLVVHSINGANPITGSESRAGNFDHYNSFTEYSLRQVLEYAGFERVEPFALHLYVFYLNPLNYVAWMVDVLNRIFFRLQFALVGKSANIFSKKIAAVAFRPHSDPDGSRR